MKPDYYRYKTPNTYVVEGVSYSTPEALLQAKERGYLGSKSMLFQRLERGWDTWDQLLKQPFHNGNKGTDQLAEMCAELDARKREIRERLAREEPLE